jgi:hypothetical protein
MNDSDARMTRRRWRASMRRSVNDLTAATIDDGENDVPGAPLAAVSQLCVTTLEAQLPTLHTLLRRLTSAHVQHAGTRCSPDMRVSASEPPAAGACPTGARGLRVLVFFPTVRLTQFFAAAFCECALVVRFESTVNCLCPSLGKGKNGQRRAVGCHGCFATWRWLMRADPHAAGWAGPSFRCTLECQKRFRRNSPTSSGTAAATRRRCYSRRT